MTNSSKLLAASALIGSLAMFPSASAQVTTLGTDATATGTNAVAVGTRAEAEGDAVEHNTVTS